MNTTDLINAWTAQYRPSTGNGYRRDIQTWLNWCENSGLDPLSDVDRSHLAFYHGWLSNLPNPRAKRGRYADASRARLLNTVTSFYRYATDAGLFTVNPMDGAKKPKVDTTIAAMPPLSRDERHALLTTVNKTTGPYALRDRAVIAVFAYLGIRASELCNLVVGDYDPARVVKNDTMPVLRVTGKGGKTTFRQCPRPLATSIDAHLRNLADIRHLTVDTLTPTAPLFPTNTGRHLTRSMAWRMVRYYATAAGIPGRVSPHSLRATYVTLALDAGVPLNQIQTDVMHTTSDTTARYDRAQQRIHRDASMVLYQLDREAGAA